MRLALLLALFVTACAHCPTDADVAGVYREVEAGNQRRLEQALADGARQHALAELADPAGAGDVRRMRFAGGEPFDVPAPYDDGAAWPAPGAGIGQEVLDDGSPGRVLLVVPGYGGGSCDSRANEVLKVARAADGKVVVVRVAIEWRYRSVHRCGSCGVGCGVPSPPMPAVVYALPATRIEEVGEEVGLAVVQESVAVGCDREIPAP